MNVFKEEDSEHERGSTESTGLGLLPNCRESVGNDSNEQVDQPKVEHHDTDDVKDTREEVLRIHRCIHQWRPLEGGIKTRNKRTDWITYTVGR
jgi:hypothetical protein